MNAESNEKSGKIKSKVTQLEEQNLHLKSKVAYLEQEIDELCTKVVLILIKDRHNKAREVWNWSIINFIQRCKREVGKTTKLLP